MSYDSIIEVLALALLEQANEVGCLEVLDGFSQRPDTEIEAVSYTHLRAHET